MGGTPNTLKGIGDRLGRLMDEFLKLDHAETNNKRVRPESDDAEEVCYGAPAKRAKVKNALFYITVTVQHRPLMKTETMMFPREVLVHHSPFMRTACSEGVDEVHLDEIRPGPFRTYMACSRDRDTDVASVIQHEKLRLAELRDRTGEYQPDVSPVYDLLSLWVLGDKLQDRGFRNRVMDGLLADPTACSSLLPPDMLKWAMAKTQPGSGLRIWIADHLAAFATPFSLDHVRQKMPEDVMFKMVGRMAEFRGKNGREMAPKQGEGRKYHGHSDGSDECS